MKKLFNKLFKDEKTKVATIAVSSFLLFVIITGLLLWKPASKSNSQNLYETVKYGKFDIAVFITGELLAENSLDIRGPEIGQNRRLRVTEFKITDLVPEGTEVKKGDYVAELDKTTFDNTLKDEQDNLYTLQEQLEMKMLDTAVALSNLRDNIKNIKFQVEEDKLTSQESQFEPPATQRRAEIQVDKTTRSLNEALKDYELKEQQSILDIRNIQNNLREQEQRVSDIETLLENFLITAPSDGMIIYKKDRSENKITAGSSVSPWENVIATLPDMSTMISKTYVNELEANKVKVGQKVEITVDAFPGQQYTGTVISVSNVGEQLINTTAKVFEVLIRIDGKNTILKPMMTSGNKIIVKSVDNVLYVPLSSVRYDSLNKPFVYNKKGKIVNIIVGESNESDIIIKEGLNEGSLILK